MEINILPNSINSVSALKNSGIKKNNEISPAIKEQPGIQSAIAAKSYASPQINFTRNWNKVIIKLKSPVADNKVSMALEEAKSLAEKFGFRLDRINGSHHQYVKKGEDILTISTHEKNVTPGTIKQFRSYIKNHNIEKL